jgi:hypothetical protein
MQIGSGVNISFRHLFAFGTLPLVLLGSGRGVVVEAELDAGGTGPGSFLVVGWELEAGGGVTSVTTNGSGDSGDADGEQPSAEATPVKNMPCTIRW